MSAIHGSNKWHNLSAIEILEELSDSTQRASNKLECIAERIAQIGKIGQIHSDAFVSKMDDVTERKVRIQKNYVVRDAGLRGAAAGGIGGSIVSGCIFGPVGAVIGLFVFAIISAFVSAYIAHRNQYHGC